MQRVRASSLIQGEDGKLRHGEEPFSGVAYWVGEEGVLGGMVAVAEGVITGPSTDWLSLPEGGLRVDRTTLKMAEDYGPWLFQGKPLTGIAYSFNRKGFCVAEVEYVDGYATEVSEREWYETGQPKVVIWGGEYTSWFPDGRLWRKGGAEELVYGLNTLDDGRLGSLVLRDASFLDLEAVRRLKPAEEMMLVGVGIDAKLLRTLREGTPIGAIRKLRLVQTRVGAEGVEVLASFENLDEVWFDGNPGLGLEEARRLERLRPGCVVHVELDEPAP